MAGLNTDKIKIDLFDYNEFIKINAASVVEVTDGIYTDRNSIPTPEGLFSYELFGTTPKDRKEIWGFIDLKDLYIHPMVYKSLRRLIPKLLDGIINGMMYVNVDADGKLYEDNENGWTGVDELYAHWDEIKIPNTNSNDRVRRLKILASLKKTEIFINKFLIIPPFYRDLKLKGTTVAVEQVNEYYSNILKRIKMIDGEKNTGFSFTMNRTKFQIQENLVAIYNFYTKEPNLAKKRGIIRRSLMGKSTDYGARLVISAPRYNIEDFKDDPEIKFDRVGVPLATICATFYPFMHKWVLDWFQHHIMTDKTIVGVDGKLYHPKNPESQFDTSFIEKMIKNFIKSPTSRYDTIPMQTEEGVTRELKFFGVYQASGKAEDLSSIANRPMTVTDLLYMAACEVTADKHVIITRYPLTDYTGIYPAKIHVLSTINTKSAYITNEVYKHYPVIDTDLPPERIAVSFIDTLIMSNTYLVALGAD